MNWIREQPGWSLLGREVVRLMVIMRVGHLVQIVYGHARAQVEHGSGLGSGWFKRESLCEESLKKLSIKRQPNQENFSTREKTSESWEETENMCVWAHRRSGSCWARERDKSRGSDEKVKKEKEKSGNSKEEPGCPHTISLPAPHRTIRQWADNN
jgi:hypothetical protein